MLPQENTPAPHPIAGRGVFSSLTPGVFLTETLARWFLPLTTSYSYVTDSPGATATDRARWVCAADKVHNAGSTLADLRRTIDVESVWSRLSGGREGTVLWYRGVTDRLRDVGFRAPIIDELDALVTAIEKA